MKDYISSSFRLAVFAFLTANFFGSPCSAALKLKPGDKKPFLVIMVDTKESMFTESTETVAGWIFPSTSGNYTMQDWLRVNFAGKVSIGACRESYDQQDDGVVKVSLDAEDPSLKEPRTIEQHCREALLKAAPFIDFSQYAKPGQKKIGSQELGILYLFARPKVAGGGTSFRFFKLPPVKLNGVEIDSFEFICAPPSRDNIGAIIHDWLHLYGEKDFYARDGTKFGVGDLHLGNIWKGSQKGKNGPSNLMPLSMENFAIVKPEVVTRSGEYTLRAYSTGIYNYLKIPSDDPKEYFLIENRQFEGFDECLANNIKRPGIVIYHVDRKKELKGNFNNDDKDHRLVTIEAANEQRYGYNEYNVLKKDNKADHDVLWQQGMEFGPETVPNSNLYSGKSSGIFVSILGPNGAEMRIRVDKYIQENR